MATPPVFSNKDFLFFRRCVLFRSFRGSSILNIKCDIERFLQDWADFFLPDGTLKGYRVLTYVLLRIVTESLTRFSM